MKKVSIIIPVYDGEVYLEKCLNSILNQSYNNLEIICVNDGSKDNSVGLIKKYQDRNSNIVLINQKNSGQASARNNGIKKSSGFYLTFVDQDDYLDSDYIETLIKNIQDNDILITGYNRVSFDDKILYKKIPKNTEWSKYKFCSSWGKLYKSKFIKNNNIEFGKYKIGEDIYFMLEACALTDKVKILSYAGYNNLRNLSSVSNNINSKKGVNNLMPMLEDMMNNIDFSNFDKKLLAYFFLKTVIHYIYNQRKNCDLNEYYILFNEYYDWLEKFYLKYDLKIKFVYQKNEELKINILINLFLLFQKIHCIKFLLLLLKKLTPKTNK